MQNLYGELPEGLAILADAGEEQSADGGRIPSAIRITNKTD